MPLLTSHIQGVCRPRRTPVKPVHGPGVNPSRLAPLLQGPRPPGAGATSTGAHIGVLTARRYRAPGPCRSGASRELLLMRARPAPEVVAWFATQPESGLPISTEDAQIAAIALAAQLQLVTRNTKDFEAIVGIELINPWQTH